MLAKKSMSNWSIRGKIWISTNKLKSIQDSGYEWVWLNRKWAWSDRKLLRNRKDLNKREVGKVGAAK